MIEIKHKETGKVLHTVEADTLVGADLCGAHLRGAHLRGAHLSGANLSGANLFNANMRDADLRKAKLLRGELRRADLSNADLSHADLSQSNMVFTQLNNAKLNYANLSNTDLLHAVLSCAALNNANLSNANLCQANMISAEMNGARLVNARMIAARLSRADLSNTDLSYGNLDFANLSNANLVGADLSNAYLSNADLSGIDLSGVNLSGVSLLKTNLINSLTLHQAKGLETISHSGPSYLDAITLRACINDLPDVFLLGVGYTLDEIENLRAMYTKGIQFYSCFLSHAELDSAFVEKLRTDLIAKSVSCWHYRYDARAGDFFRRQINEAIKVHDKLVLVCSAQSLGRPEVVEEILEAIETERQHHVQKLFPIRLDDFVLSPGMDALYRTLPPRQRREDWLTYLRAYNIADFRCWKEHDPYQEELNRLLRDLKNPQAR